MGKTIFENRDENFSSQENYFIDLHFRHLKAVWSVDLNDVPRTNKEEEN